MEKEGQTVPDTEPAEERGKEQEETSGTLVGQARNGKERKKAGSAWPRLFQARRSFEGSEGSGRDGGARSRISVALGLGNGLAKAKSFGENNASYIGRGLKGRLEGPSLTGQTNYHAESVHNLLGHIQHKCGQIF